MADTRDLKSLVKYLTCGFESRSWHFWASSVFCENGSEAASRFSVRKREDF